MDVNETVDAILSGAGWCTEDYIINFCTELSIKQQQQVMLKLAKLGKLYKEDSITDFNSDSPPKVGKMTVKDVFSIKF